MHDPDFFTRDFQERPEVIEGIARRAAFTVDGSFNVGKSPLLQYLAPCAINGMEWCAEKWTEDL
jgi:hypothetical protein